LYPEVLNTKNCIIQPVMFMAEAVKRGEKLPGEPQIVASARGSSGGRHNSGESEIPIEPSKLLKGRTQK